MCWVSIMCRRSKSKEGVSERGGVWLCSCFRRDCRIRKDKCSLSHRDKEFTAVSLNKQIVRVRMHWLPIYLGENFVKHFFTKHDKDVEVRRIETNYGKLELRPE